MKVNKNAIIVALILCIVGLVLIFKMQSPTWIGVGGSLLASSLVILLNVFLVERVPEDPLKDWGIAKVYETRAEKNADSDPHLDKARHCVDGIAFGLSSFRGKNAERVRACLNRGVSFRFLVMDPDSPFVHAREEEEGAQHGHIEKTIRDLVHWADELNAQKFKGRIEIRGYQCMTLDFYWRIDDEIYMGPYWYGRPSQVTITYKLKRSGRCFATYSEYFDKLWYDPSMRKLTK